MAKARPAQIAAIAYGERFSEPFGSVSDAQRDRERRVEIVATRISGAETGFSVPNAPGERSAVERPTAEPPPTNLPPRPESPLAPNTDDLLVFDPDSADLSLRLPDDRLAMTGAGSLEFWVAAGWNDADALPYDPTVLAISDGETARISVHVRRDRRAILLWNGTTDAPVGVEADFTDGRLHHVVISLLDGTARIFVDGLAAPGPLAFLPGGAAAERLEVAAGPRGVLAFIGRLGGIRFWSGALDAADTEAMMAAAQPPEFSDMLGDIWIGEVVPDSEGRARFVAPKRTIALAGPWWAPFGATQLGLANRAEMHDEPLAPDLAALFDPRKGYSATEMQSILDEIGDRQSLDCPPGEICETDEELIAIATDVIAEREVAHDAADGAAPNASYPLVRIEPVGAVDAEDLMGGEQVGERSFASFDPNTARLSQICVWADDGVRSIELTSVSNEDGQPTAWLLGQRLASSPEGEEFNDPTAVLHIAPTEDVLAISGERNNELLSRLRIHTTARVYGPFGERSAGRPFRLRVPFGSPFRGFEIRGGRLANLGIHSDRSDREAGLVMIFEDGRAARFAREGRNSYRAVTSRIWLPGFRAKISSESQRHPLRPALQAIGPERLSLEGFDRDLVAVADHPEPRRQTRFDDTFVTLSKAVNLPSNYRGYDIARMDPIHLTDSGVSEAIFAMPDGDANDYHDFNRIFVPNDLIYTPLFRGRAHNHATTSVTLDQYKDTFSRTVGADLGGALAPAMFSLSDTIEQVRGGFTEQKIVHTTGLSQVYFYALSLDKARMALSPGFRTSVAALAESGNTRAFIDAYGTHYAGSVFYGGLGALDMQSDTTTTGTSASDMETFSLKASAMLDEASKTSLGANFSVTNKHETEARETFGDEVDNFYWVGGTHMGADKSHWSVGPDGAVPVHVDLRPIDELLGPFFFDDPEITERVRQELKEAVDTRLERLAALERSLDPPPRHQFKLTLDRLVCEQGVAGWKRKHLLWSDEAFKARAYGVSARAVTASGPLAAGVKPDRQSWIDTVDWGRNTSARYMMSRLCVDEDDHGFDLMSVIVPEPANRVATFALRDHSLQTGGVLLDLRVVGRKGTKRSAMQGTQRIEVRDVMCGEAAVGSEFLCEVDFAAAATPFKGKRIVEEENGPGKLRLEYTLSYEGSGR